jgi:hypothetical protein
MLAGQDPRFVRSVRFWLSLEQELRMFIASRFIATSLSIATLAFAMSTPDIAAAADRRVRVVNGTNVTVTRFYASNTSRGDWEEDILGSSVLPAGHSVMINIDDGSGACQWPESRSVWHECLPDIVLDCPLAARPAHEPSATCLSMSGR